MAKSKKKRSKDKIYISIISILAIIILIFVITNLTTSSKMSSEMREKLDSHEDELTACGLELKSFIYSTDFESILNKLDECKEITNDAQVKINSWGREDNTDEVKAAKIDYEASSDFLDAYIILNEVNSGDFYSEKEGVIKLQGALSLLDEATSKLDSLENDYFHTEYHERYCAPKKMEMEQSRKESEELKNQIQEIIDYYDNLECEEGYVLGEDYLCYKK
jgi:hypothetical protein